ncbi:hypothetical protein WJX81_002258 [Elliptochloris bilobata]|uniref:DNA-directed RNA polymerase III subunit n=1 Tax=Elliptochloris bilobata TaxID=381761 RepID=A0AAW1S4U3_9CHLO
MLDAEELGKKYLASQSKLQVLYSRALPYHIRAPIVHAGTHKFKTGLSAAALPADGQSQNALEDVMTLSSRNFPQELYTRTQRRHSERAASAQAFSARDKDLGADFFERFDRLDKAAGERDDEAEGPSGAPGGGASGRGGERREAGAARKPGAVGEEEEEEGVEADEEEPGFEEDDDYLQGAQYDDDEGYEDTLDDGGDEGPTY